MSQYCKYCGELVSDVVKERDSENRVVWVGCRSCYERRIELMKE